MRGIELKRLKTPLVLALANVIFSAGVWMFIIAVILIAVGVSVELQP